VRIIHGTGERRTFDFARNGGYDMKTILTAGAIGFAMVVAGEPAFARGGAPSIMGSPGYQRRLQESRQQLAQPQSPQFESQSSRAARHKVRHRHRD